MSRPVLLDTSVALYAVGGAHPTRDAARRVVQQAEVGALELHASVELVQEFLHHRMRRVSRPDAIAQALRVRDLCVLHDFDRRVLAGSIDLIASTPTIRGRDAVHAATALEHGLDVIISTDPAFDGIRGLRRVDPHDVLSLRT